jgi:hypothetical protein
LFYASVALAAFGFTLAWPRLMRVYETRIVAAHWRAVAAAHDEEDPTVPDGRYGELEWSGSSLNENASCSSASGEKRNAERSSDPLVVVIARLYWLAAFKILVHVWAARAR